MSFSNSLIDAQRNFSPKNLPAMAGRVGWTSPSNIAIIKYWGKRPVQIPMNPSLSITLDSALTKTDVEYAIDPSIEKTRLQFFFEGSKSELFEKRIRTFLSAIGEFFPWLDHADMTIHSENTFPHSSGIASSASAMGALALCLCEMDEAVKMETIQDKISSDKDDTAFYRKASCIARLGSGSASRSVYGNMVLWGKTEEWKGSSDEYAVPITDIHPALTEIRDAILIVESGSKKVSSSAGHSLMDGNPFAGIRFNQARANLNRLKPVIESGDWPGFIEIMENEALSLHAMMMTGNPGYLLMQPGTLNIIRKIREFRKETGLQAGFTIDAGANVHMLYPESESRQIEAFINSELAGYCENKIFIRDRMGAGPQKR